MPLSHTDDGLRRMTGALVVGSALASGGTGTVLSSATRRASPDNTT